MPPEDLALREALRFGGLDVILPQHVEHARAHQAGNRRQRTESQCEGGQQRLVELAPALNREEIDAEGFAQLQAEEVLQHRAQNEARHGDADHGDEHGYGVPHAAALDGGHSAEQNTDDDGKDDRADAQIRRNEERFGDNGHHVAVIGDGNPQIAAQAVAHIHQILHKHRLIQAVFRVHVGHCRRGDGLVADERIARQHAHHEKRERDEHKQRQHRIDETLDNVANQRAPSFFVSFMPFSFRP